MNFNFRTTTGIYVGAKHVYIAQLKGGFLRPRLVKFAKTAIAAPQVQPEKDKSTEPIVQAIEQVLQESKISAKRVVTALAGKDVLIRYFQMPRIPQTEWETAIKFEAKKYIPFKIEELMWDYHVVLPQAKQEMMDITFVAVKRTLAQKHLSVLEQAGLKPKILEPAPFSLVRLLGFGHQLVKTSPTAIIDVDYGGADINIIKNKICYLTRDVSLPEEQTVMFDNLLNELKMTLDYYAKLFPADAVSKILLCGEVDLQDWDKTLAEELKLPVEKINYIRSIKVKKVLPPLSMAIAVGLALRGQAQIAPEVNLYLTQETAPQAAAAAKKKGDFEFSADIRQAALRAGILSCIGLLILFAICYQRVGQQRKQLQQVNALRPKTTIAAGSISYDRTENVRRELKAKWVFLNRIIDKKIFWTSKFNQLAKMLPQGAWLTNLSLAQRISDQNKVTLSLELQGVAYHQDAVQAIEIITKFVAALKEDVIFGRGFQEIKLGKMDSGQLSQRPVKNFTISCF